jgi:hypothetical protein
MTHKAEAQINYCLKKIEADTFDQETIATLLINLRDFVPKDSFTRELGDFIAHPEKDRGIALSHVEVFEMKTVNGKICMTIPLPTEGDTLIAELQTSVAALARPEKQQHVSTVIQTRGNDLLLCYLGILHFTTLFKKVPGSQPKQVGLIRAKSMGSELFLSAVILMAGQAEVPFFSTRLVKYTKCAFDVRELDKNHRIMAFRGDGGLKLRKIGE